MEFLFITLTIIEMQICHFYIVEKQCRFCIIMKQQQLFV